MMRAVGLLLTLGCLSTTALAQEPVDPMDACARETDAAARLACFDREVQRRHAGASGAAGRSQTDDNVGLDGKQLIKKLKEQRVQPEPVKLIVATITRLRQRPDHFYSFELDNGQVWEQTDSAPGLFVKPNDTVTIRPGALGAFFLKTQDRQSIRVHRVR
jgi:hypothetical protein